MAVLVTDIFITARLYVCSAITIILLLLLFFSGIMIHIFFHEIGHFIGGLLSGYRLIYIYTGLLSVNLCCNSKILLKIEWFREGQCAMYPKDIFNRKFVAYNMGGIVMNLLIIIVAFVLSFIDIFRLFFLGLFFAGIPLLFNNAIPAVNSGVPNDAFIIRLLLKSDSARKDYFNYLRLFAELYFRKPVDKKMYCGYLKLPETQNDNLIFYKEIKKLLQSMTQV